MSAGKVKQLAFSEGTAVTSPPTAPTFAAVGISTYTDDAAFVAAKGSAAAAGDIYFKTGTGPREYDGSAWRTLATLDGTETLSAKTLASPAVTGALTITEGSAPSAPASSKLSVYAKTDDKLYLLNSAGTEKEVSTADTALSNPMTTSGDVIYGGASGAAMRLAGNTTTTTKFLVQTGDGTDSAAPSWGTPAATASAAGLVSTTTQTFGGQKKLQDGYYGNVPTVLTGSSSIATSDSATAPASYTTALSDSNYFTSHSVSSGIVTLTMARAGYYRITVSIRAGSSGGTTANYFRCDLNTSATSTSSLVYPVSGGSNVALTNETAASEQQDAYSIFESIWNVTAAGQTIVIHPSGYQVFASGTHTLYVAIAIYPI